jgi:hypothetical protein
MGKAGMAFRASFETLPSVAPQDEDYRAAGPVLPSRAAATLL